MISREAALSITSGSFPRGPETLAKSLAIAVQKSPLHGTEGWCIRSHHTVIRVNSRSSQSRQRFTLAHELAHLVLGTEPDIAHEPFRSDIAEEREADSLASEFLIPKSELDRYIRGQLPIDAKSLVRLSKAGNVSPVMAACRVVSATVELGLHNAAVVFFQDDVEQWRYSSGLRFQKEEAEQLLRDALKAVPEPVRRANHDGNVVVGSIIDAQSYQVLLLQLLPKKTANQKTREERLRELASSLFADDEKFRPSLAGVLGTIKSKCAGKSLEEAIVFFNKEYVGRKYTGHRLTKLKSAQGKAYIRLYLEHWFN